METVVKVLAPQTISDFVLKVIIIAVMGNLVVMMVVYSKHGFFPSGLTGQLVETTIAGVPFAAGFLIIIRHQRTLELQLAEDITNKKTAETLLRQQSEQLQLQKDTLNQKNQTLKLVERRLNEAQRLARMGSWYLDLKTNEVTWTKALYEMYGFDPSLPPPPFSEHEKLFTAKSWKKLEAALSHTIETGNPYELKLQTVKADGGLGWMLVQGEVVFDDMNGTGKIGLQGIAQDITAQETTEIKMRKLALTEPLTGVANRTAFSDHIGHSINVHERKGGRSVLLLVDLDGFKIINDRYGHAAGDATLKNVASILSRHTRKTDIVARLGGDEFALFLNDVTDGFDHIEKVQQIIDAVVQPIEVGGQPVKVGMSAGLATYPEDADNLEDLLKCADIALYEAKKVKGSAYEVFRPGMAFLSEFNS